MRALRTNVLIKSTDNCLTMRAVVCCIAEAFPGLVPDWNAMTGPSAVRYGNFGEFTVLSRYYIILN